MENDSQNQHRKVTPRGKYPHVKCVGDWIYVSGTSSRKSDNSIAGATKVDEMGTMHLDIKVQTQAVLENIEKTLQSVGATKNDLVDMTSFLVNMNDFAGYNEAYADFFDDQLPTRTTVAVHQLPHPHLLIEIKAIAFKKQNE